MSFSETYSGLLPFKMLLIGLWNGLSDREGEEVSVNLKAMRFCGLNMEDDVLYHGILSLFRMSFSSVQSFEE